MRVETGLMRKCGFVVCGIWVGVCAGLARAQCDTLHVPGEYATIQAAIDAATDCDTVLVADGVYAGDGNKNLDFGGRAITVRSENGPDACTIDCEGSGRGFVFSNNETDESVVEGFTITGGSIAGNQGYGGGILCSPGSPTISNCVFYRNTAYIGGGLYCSAASNPIVENCVFMENAVSDQAGGMYARSQPTVRNCSFIRNSAATSGGGFGGFSSEHATTMVNCSFVGNTAEDGGAGFLNDDGSPTLVNCFFDGNVARTGSGGGFHRNHGGEPSLINCTFVNNTCGAFGGGLFVDVEQVEQVTQVTNCVFWGNDDRNGGGETSQIHIYAGASATVTYTCIDGCATFCDDPNDHNTGADPMFADPGSGDFRLTSPASSCIDAGNNDVVPEDVDLDGNSRFVDDPDVDDTGNGEPPIVDLGAYEYQTTLDCDQITRLKAECFRRCRDGRLEIEAVVRTTLPQGTVLTLTLDGGDRVEVTIKRSGRGKAKWVGTGGGSHAICIEECEGLCTTVDCCG